jgi:hypothetical protein
MKIRRTKGKRASKVLAVICSMSLVVALMPYLPAQSFADPEAVSQGAGVEVIPASEPATPATEGDATTEAEATPDGDDGASAADQLSQDSPLTPLSEAPDDANTLAFAQNAGGEMFAMAMTEYELVLNDPWELTASLVTGNSISDPSATTFVLDNLTDDDDPNIDIAGYLTWDFEYTTSSGPSPITIYDPVNPPVSPYTYDINGDYANYYVEIDAVPIFDWNAYNTDHDLSPTTYDDTGTIKPVKVKITNYAVTGAPAPTFTLNSDMIYSTSDPVIYYNSGTSTIPLTLTPGNNNPYNPITGITWEEYEIDGSSETTVGSNTAVTGNPVLSAPFSFESVVEQKDNGNFEGKLTPVDLITSSVSANRIRATVSLASGGPITVGPLTVVDDTAPPTVDVSLESIEGDGANYRGIKGTVIVTDENYDLKPVLPLIFEDENGASVTLNLYPSSSQPLDPNEHQYEFGMSDAPGYAFPDGTYTQGGLMNALTDAVQGQNPPQEGIKDKAGNAPDASLPDGVSVGFVGVFPLDPDDGTFTTNSTPLEVAVDFAAPTKNLGAESYFYKSVTGTITVSGDGYTAALNGTTFDLIIPAALSASFTLTGSTVGSDVITYTFELSESVYNKSALLSCLQDVIENDIAFEDNTGRAPTVLPFTEDSAAPLDISFTIDNTAPEVTLAFTTSPSTGHVVGQTVCYPNLGGTVTVVDTNYTLATSSFSLSFTDSTNQMTSVLVLTPSSSVSNQYDFAMYPNHEYVASDFESKVRAAIEADGRFKDKAGNTSIAKPVNFGGILQSRARFATDDTPPLAELVFDAPSEASLDPGDNHTYYQELSGFISVVDEYDNPQATNHTLSFSYQGTSYTVELYSDTPIQTQGEYIYRFDVFPEGRYNIAVPVVPPASPNPANLAEALKTAIESDSEFEDALGHDPEASIDFNNIASDFVVDRTPPEVELAITGIDTYASTATGEYYKGIEGTVTVTELNYVPTTTGTVTLVVPGASAPLELSYHSNPTPGEYVYKFVEFPDGDYTLGTLRTDLQNAIASNGAFKDKAQNAPSNVDVTVDFGLIAAKSNPSDPSNPSDGYSFIVDGTPSVVEMVFNAPTGDDTFYTGDSDWKYYQSVGGTITVVELNYTPVQTPFLLSFNDNSSLFDSSASDVGVEFSVTYDAISSDPSNNTHVYQFTAFPEGKYVKSVLEGRLISLIEGTVPFQDDIHSTPIVTVDLDAVPSDKFVIDITPPKVELEITGVGTYLSNPANPSEHYTSEYYNEVAGTVTVTELNYNPSYDSSYDPIGRSFKLTFPDANGQTVELELTCDPAPAGNSYVYTFTAFPDGDYTIDTLTAALQAAIASNDVFKDKAKNAPRGNVDVTVDFGPIAANSNPPNDYLFTIDGTPSRVSVAFDDPEISPDAYSGDAGWQYYQGINGTITVDELNYDPVRSSFQVSFMDSSTLYGDPPDAVVEFEVTYDSANSDPSNNIHVYQFATFHDGRYFVDDLEARLTTAIENMLEFQFHDRIHNTPEVDFDFSKIPSDRFVIDRTPIEVEIAFATTDGGISKYEVGDDATAYFQNLTATVTLSDENKLQNLPASIVCNVFTNLDDASVASINSKAFTLVESTLSPVGGLERTYNVTFSPNQRFTSLGIINAIRNAVYDKAGNHPFYHAADGEHNFTLNTGTFNPADPLVFGTYSEQDFAIVVDTIVPWPNISSTESITDSSNRNGERETFDENDGNAYSVYDRDGVTVTLSGRDDRVNNSSIDDFAGIWKLEYFKVATSDVTNDMLNTDFYTLFGTYAHRLISVNPAENASGDTPTFPSDESPTLSYNEFYDAGDRFIYVLKATDKSGMAQYYISDGLIVDTFDPAIESLELASTNLISRAAEPWLYNGSVTVNVTASDNSPALVHNASASRTLSTLENIPVSSGLASVFNWEVTKGGQVVSGLTGNPSLQAIAGTGGSVGTYASATPTWNEIVSLSRTAQGSFTISATPNNPTNNYNDLVAEVTVWDATDNQSSKQTVRFSIDTMGPVVSVVYDNNDVRNNRYFNAGRTATVTVSDNNFSATGMNIAAPGASLGSWSQRGTSGDEGTFTTTVGFATDGDYTLNITGRDAATNGIRPVSYTGAATQDFTVDLTNPVLSVAYDNNSVRNDRYYMAARTGTITVVEHNFGSGEGATINATRDGAGFSSGGGWGGGGDTHSTSIPYSTDGEYTFHVEYTDLAGNRANSVSDDNFVVDLTAPTLEFLGEVQDRTAFNTDTITPEVAFHDQNYDDTGVGVTLSKVERAQSGGSVEPRATYTNIAYGQEAAVNAHNVEVGRAGDGIYTLTANITDLAGNEFEDSIIYSVNRFGSTWYIEDGSATDRMLDGYYTNAPATVEVHEVNATEVANQRVNYANAGAVTDLAQGQGFTVTSSGDEAQWKDYTYRLAATNFGNEGLYEVTIYSEDIAGNTSTNRAPKVDEQNPADSLPVDFVVDVTPPSIVLNGVEDNGRYTEAERIVKLNVEDNLALDMVDVYLNDSPAPASTFAADEVKGAGGTVEFTIPTSADLQTLTVNARDMAGNGSEDTTVQNIFVNPSPLAQFVRNTPLFVGSIAGVLLVAAAIIFFLFFWRRRKGEEGSRA